ncbi:MAG: hypothetical protein Kapaf2KO_00580 [Candidatus Kapaibacteriales bacterium]
MVNSVQKVSTSFNTESYDQNRRESLNQQRLSESLTRRLSENSDSLISENDEVKTDIKVKQFANELSKYIDNENLMLDFSRDNNTDKMVMRIINNETKEVIRQFPAEISLKIARILSETESGNLANAKV